MAKEKLIRAAGAVVLKPADPRRWGAAGPQVLVVHRPRYDDWTLPKGKSEPGESDPVAAVREVLEETGVRIRLDCPLDSVQYRTGKGPKIVFWWRGEVVSETPHPEDDEVDEVAWWSLSRARRRLTYPEDRGLVEQAVALPPTTAIVLARHAKAMQRSHWSGKDWLRPLTGRGRQQALNLVPLLGAYGITNVHSSSSTRCATTVLPYATAAGVELHGHGELSEEQGAHNSRLVGETLSRIVAEALEEEVPTVICGHRPVIPHMQDALSISERAMATAECLVMHISDDGEPIALERHRG